MNGPSYEKVVWVFVAYVVWLGTAMYMVGKFDLAVDALRGAVDRRRTGTVPPRSGSCGKATGSATPRFAFPRPLHGDGVFGRNGVTVTVSLDADGLTERVAEAMRELDRRAGRSPH